MPISVSTAFHNAESADVNIVKAKVNLVLGNYCATATVESTGDYSADYPDSGAINGDRTEINIGPASTADNGVGGSSWRSSLIPDGLGNTSIEIDFGTTRTINRLKLYHLSGHALTDFAAYYDDATYGWLPIFGISGGTAPDGYGVGPYGDGPYGGGSSYSLITTTGEVDIIDFADISTDKIMICVFGTAVAGDYANIVEVEAYRVCDISDRVKSIETDRQRDYKLQNFLASSVTVGLINSDKFFSPQYTPTADEIAAGFINSELSSGIGIEVESGFETDTGIEYARIFTGRVNTISPNSKAREATLSARDDMQLLLSGSDYSSLKTNIKINDAICYLLNRKNISSWEINCDDINITLPVFFSTGENILDIIREMLIAAGNGGFYFDENNIATVRNYSPRGRFAVNTDDLWNAGTAVSCQVGNPFGTLRRNYIIDDFSATNIDTDKWDSPTISDWSITAGKGLTTSTTTKIYSKATITPTPTQWYFKMWDESTGAGTYESYFAAMDSGKTYGYGIKKTMAIGSTISETLTLGRFDSGVFMPLASAQSNTPATSSTTFRFGIEYQGDSRYKLTFWKDDENLFNLEVIDNSYQSLPYIQVWQSGASSLAFWDDFWTGTARRPYYTSQIIDCGSTLNAYNRIYGNIATQNRAVVYWYLRTSADGVTFGDWQYLGNDTWAGGSGYDISAITAERYVQFHVEFGEYPTADAIYPVITSVDLTWTINNPSIPSSASFSFSGNILENEQAITDTLAGDSVIINYVIAESTKPLLSGTDTDEIFSYVIGQNEISTTYPLVISSPFVFKPIVQSGADTSRLSGVNPAAISITTSSGSVTWLTTKNSPTYPEITITPTGAVTITALQFQGKTYAYDTMHTALSSDSTSIRKYGKRDLTISNRYILGQAQAQDVADAQIEIYKDPKTYIPTMDIRPTFSLALNDRVTITDEFLAINEDYLIVGVKHYFTVSLDSFEVKTSIIPQKII